MQGERINGGGEPGDLTPYQAALRAGALHDQVELQTDSNSSLGASLTEPRVHQVRHGEEITLNVATFAVLRHVEERGRPPDGWIRRPNSKIGILVAVSEPLDSDKKLAREALDLASQQKLIELRTLVDRRGDDMTVNARLLKLGNQALRELSGYYAPLVDTAITSNRKLSVIHSMLDELEHASEVLGDEGLPPELQALRSTGATDPKQLTRIIDRLTYILKAKETVLDSPMRRAAHYFVDQHTL